MRISDWSSDVCSSDLRPGRSATAAGSVNCGNAFPIMRDSIVVSDGLMMPNATTMMNSEKRPSGNQKTQCFMHKRSEERRAGKERVSKCRSRWLPAQLKKNYIKYVIDKQ